MAVTVHTCSNGTNLLSLQAAPNSPLFFGESVSHRIELLSMFWTISSVCSIFQVGKESDIVARLTVDLSCFDRIWGQWRRQLWAKGAGQCHKGQSICRKLDDHDILQGKGHCFSQPSAFQSEWSEPILFFTCISSSTLSAYQWDLVLLSWTTSFDHQETSEAEKLPETNTEQ